jgi:hypothetical protein
MSYTLCDRPIEGLWNKKPRRGLTARGEQHTRQQMMSHTGTSFGGAKCHRRSGSFGGGCPMILFRAMQISNAGILSQLGHVFFMEWRMRLCIMPCHSALSPSIFRKELKGLRGSSSPDYARDPARNFLLQGEGERNNLCRIWSLLNSRNDCKHGR